MVENIIIGIVSIVVAVFLSWLQSKDADKNLQEQIDVLKTNSKKEIDNLKRINIIQIDSQLLDIDKEISEVKQQCQDYIDRLEYEDRRRMDEIRHSSWNPDFDRIRQEDDEKERKIKNMKIHTQNQLNILTTRKQQLQQAKSELEKEISN